MFRTRIAITVGTAAIALAAPVAADAQDPHSPDAMDRRAAAQAARNPQGPDARDAAIGRPDARDRAIAAEAARLSAPTPPTTEPVTSPTSPAAHPATSVIDAPDGFSWTDAGIGAAATLGLLCALGAAVLLLTHVRRRGPVGLIRP